VQEDILQGGTVHLQVADPHTAAGKLGEHGDGDLTTSGQRDPQDLRFGGAGRLGAGAEQLPRGLPLPRVGHGQPEMVAAQAAPAWRGGIRVVCIDMCSIYLSAARRMLPQAQVAVDLFHVVQLAVKTVGDVRRRAIREKYGRRGKSGDPEYGIKNLLTWNLEHLTPEQCSKIIDVLDSSAQGQQAAAAAWIAKEKLSDVLNLRARITGSTPCERNVRDRLYAFYHWCAQHEDIPELISLAQTIARWEDQITCAVLTGVTNATSESLNRLAKLEARQAYGFRNPASQRRRVRIACTRSRRHPAPTNARGRTRTVTGRYPDPG
jgi:transposase